MRVFDIHFIRRWGNAQGGAAAVEFAILGPLLVVLLMGIVSYGGYFWIAHSVQQMANDSARAAIAGLDDSEREALARRTIEAEAAGELGIENTDVEVERNGDHLTVRVTYDASRSPFWAFDKLLPMPPAQVERAATIRLGGY